MTPREVVFVDGVRTPFGCMDGTMREMFASQMGAIALKNFIDKTKTMGIGPAYAIPLALKRAGLKLSKMDHRECNEAFAVQNLAVIAELEKQTGEKVNRSIWNPLGGAISYGHPNGASGARICMFTFRQLARTGGRYGFFSSCCGGGLGVATVIENLQR